MPDSRPDLAQCVTIVSGLPRSGTSMMMQMLAAGGIPALSDGQRTADDDNPKGYLEFEPVKKLRADSSWVPTARGKALKVIHALVPSLPTDLDYRVVFMIRDLDEVARSQATMLARHAKAGAALTPEQLAAAYRVQLDKTFAWLDANPRFEVLRVQFAELIKDPGSGIAAINGFLGGTLDEQAMAAVIDPDLYRNRSKA